MMLIKNDILLTKKDSVDVFERILLISEDYKYCITIQMNVDKLLFDQKSIEEIEHLHNEGICELYNETVELYKIDDTDISPVALAYRDKAYEAIKYISNQDDEIAILTNPKKRSKIIKDTGEKMSISVSVLYKYLRVYLQGGKLKNALLPKFYLCGSKGNVKNNTQKSGRKSYEEVVTGRTRGVVVDDIVRNIFEVAINRYYKKGNSRTLTQTYEEMIRVFFTDDDGEKVFDEYNIPTYRQFAYFYYKNRNLEEILRGRNGNKKFDLTMRPLLSNSTVEALGPGFKYQIDATMADVYLVNRMDGRSVVGRPVLYLVVDVFSRMIVGFHVGLEGPSWNGAASALYNCMEDKVELFKRYGIDISKEEWPSAGLPEVLLADRGELVGPIAEKIVEILNITIENTPSYRGDAKAIVEQNFNAVNCNIKHWTPGAVKQDYRERGERRYELDAKLNIDDFTQLILHSIFERNNRALVDYPLSEKMVQDGVEPIPTQIWKWGMKNRSGRLHTVSDDVIKSALLRDGKAVVTERGIRFQKEFYLTKLANENERYIKARVMGKETVDILFDNRDMSVIYMMDSNEKKLIPCFLKEESTWSFNKTYEEIVDFDYMKTVRDTGLRIKNLKNKNNMNFEIKEIIDNAMKRNTSKVDIKDIKKNRKIENSELRKEQSLSKYTGYEKDTNVPVEETKEINSKQVYLKRIEEMKGDKAV